MFHRRPRRFNPAVRPASLRQGDPIPGPSLSRRRTPSPGMLLTVRIHFCGSLVLCLRAERRARWGRHIDAVLGSAARMAPGGWGHQWFSPALTHLALPQPLCDSGLMVTSTTASLPKQQQRKQDHV